MQLKITYSVIIWSARLYGILRIFSAWFPADILKTRSRLTKNLVGKVGLNALKMHFAQYFQWPFALIHRVGHFYGRLTTMPEKFVLDMTR